MRFPLSTQCANIFCAYFSDFVCLDPIQNVPTCILNEDISYLCEQNNSLIFHSKERRNSSRDLNFESRFLVCSASVAAPARKDATRLRRRRSWRIRCTFLFRPQTETFAGFLQLPSNSHQSLNAWCSPI